MTPEPHDGGDNNEQKDIINIYLYQSLYWLFTIKLYKYSQYGHWKCPT